MADGPRLWKSQPIRPAIQGALDSQPRGAAVPLAENRIDRLESGDQDRSNSRG